MIVSINFVNAKLNSNEAIPDYLVHLTGLKDRLVECGGAVDESMFKGLMFQGLAEEYNVILHPSPLCHHSRTLGPK